MLYVILGIVLLLFLAAGILAYQNSKLISNRKMNGSSSRSAVYRYTIFDLSISNEAERSQAIPLFQFTVSGGSDGSILANRSGSTFILCRVAPGKGEMVQNDAQKWLLNLIHRAAGYGALIEHQSFIHTATDHVEKELIMNLEDAVQSSGRMEC